MTDAATAPGLTDVWNLLLAVLGSQSQFLTVVFVLAALLALIMMIDGIRANFRRPKLQALHIERAPYVPSRSTQALSASDSKTRPTRALRPKRLVRKASSHRAARPSINRIVPEPLPLLPAYRHPEWDPSREQAD